MARKYLAMPETQVVKEFGMEETDRQTVQQEWDLIERFIMPFRGKFFYDQRSEHSIDWRHRDIYDSTAVMAAQSLASSLHSGLTNPADKWFSLVYTHDETNEVPGALEWLEEADRIVFEALQESNFNLEVNEGYQDLVGFGSALITEEVESETEWRGLDFNAVPIKEAYFRQDRKGQVYRFWRRLQWTPSQIIDKWGRDNVPEKIIKQEEGAPDNKLDVIFCIWRRAEFDARLGQVLGPKKRPFGYKYVLREGAELLGDEGGYYEMPAFAPRWRKTSLSKWGNSPAMIALADVMTLNQVVELVLNAAEKVVDPTTLVEERAILSDLTLKAGGITVVRKVGGIKAHESGARFDVSQMRIEDLRAAIKSYFFVDQLEMKESPAMTATEVNVRYEMMQRLLGPTMGRMQTDFLDPMVKRSFNICFRANRLPPMPETMMNASLDLDIQYSGPLARSQTMDTVGSIERWISLLGAAAEVGGAEAMDVPNWEKIAREVGTLLSIPQKIMRSHEEVRQIQETRAEMQRAQQAAEIAKTNSEAEGNMAQGEQ